MKPNPQYHVESGFLDKTYDEKLENIPGLKWLPWVGSKYSQKKLLIVAESHYDDGDDWLECVNATRAMINHYGVMSKNPEYENCAILRPIEKIVYNKPQVSYEERENLWSSVVFFNLVQRLLPTRNERPDENDFDKGWNVFFEVVNLLKPEYILKCGKSGDGMIGHLLTNKNPNWKYEDKEYYTNPRLMNISSDGHEFKIFFINHPSGSYGFSYEEWGRITQENFPWFINSINKQ